MAYWGEGLNTGIFCCSTSFLGINQPLCKHFSGNHREETVNCL